MFFFHYLSLVEIKFWSTTKELDIHEHSLKIIYTQYLNQNENIRIDYKTIIYILVQVNIISIHPTLATSFVGLALSRLQRNILLFFFFYKLITTNSVRSPTIVIENWRKHNTFDRLLYHIPIYINTNCSLKKNKKLVGNYLDDFPPRITVLFI